MAPTEQQATDRWRYTQLVGVGGVGTGMFFALEGDHRLGRNESRPAALLDIRDYCKLHIITHYAAVLLGAAAPGGFRVIPIARVGADEAGRRLLLEMAEAGMDVSFVQTVDGLPTLFSVCYQYPDGSGGNITTEGSAAATLTSSDIDRVTPLLARDGDRCIALAAPEVPLRCRQYLLEMATEHGAFRVACFASSEVAAARELGLLSKVDLLSLNEEEAGVLAGGQLDPQRPGDFLDRCARVLSEVGSGTQVVVSAGRHGAFAYAGGIWDHRRAPMVSAVSTAGAGDALLAGILSALAIGAPLIAPGSARAEEGPRPLSSALDFGVLLAAFSVTSPHTIHPAARPETLAGFASEIGATVSAPLTRLLGMSAAGRGASNE